MAHGLTPRGVSRLSILILRPHKSLVRHNSRQFASDAEYPLLAQPWPGLGATCSHTSLLAKSEDPEVKYRLPAWRSPRRPVAVSMVLTYPPYVVLCQSAPSSGPTELSFDNFFSRCSPACSLPRSSDVVLAKFDFSSEQSAFNCTRRYCLLPKPDPLAVLWNGMVLPFRRCLLHSARSQWLLLEVRGPKTSSTRLPDLLTQRGIRGSARDGPLHRVRPRMWRLSFPIDADDYSAC